MDFPVNLDAIFNSVKFWKIAVSMLAKIPMGPFVPAQQQGQSFTLKVWLLDLQLPAE